MGRIRRATGVAALATLLVSTAALTAPTVAAAPRGPVPVPERYIVGTESRSATAEVTSSVRDRGARVEGVYAKAMTGFTATLTPDQAADLRADPQVDSVTADRRFHTTGVQTNPTWGLDRIDQRSASRNGSYRYTTTGASVTAFVVDTGVLQTHRQFGGRARSGYDFVDGDTVADDCFGHGTHVAGTIAGSTYGAAKSAKIVSVRVLDCGGSGWASDIIDGLDWVIANKPAGPAVVNMSIGGGSYKLLDQAVERTIAAGIPVVAAAGNEGLSACGTSPGRVKRAITVAATDSSDRRPEWSNYGSCVDLFAPGVGVRSASMVSNGAAETMSGTSMATPHVAGLVARYLQTHRTATPAQVAKALLDSATTERVRSKAGSPDRLAYAKPPVVVPGLPTKVTASKSNKSKTATITWAKPRDDGGRAIKSYRVTRSGKDAKGRGPSTVTVSAKARKHTFSGLKAGSYTVSVQAVNSIGRGAAVAKTVKLS